MIDSILGFCVITRNVRTHYTV